MASGAVPLYIESPLPVVACAAGKTSLHFIHPHLAVRFHRAVQAEMAIRALQPGPGQMDVVAVNNISGFLQLESDIATSDLGRRRRLGAQEHNEPKSN